ncbi:uracil-DNA glycosylase [Azospirillaceae bacterium]
MNIINSSADVVLADVMTQARACCVCASDLPHQPRPVLRGRASARLLIVGQAPGARVHKSGIPWDDPSGDRLRQWLGFDQQTFYDEGLIAIVPIGLCFPGVALRGGDRPPRSECAPLWHPRLRGVLTNIKLTLLIGLHAHIFYLGARREKTMSGTVRDGKKYLPEFMPLPHPSWRNNHWLKNNLWFEKETLPLLRDRCRSVIS